MVISAADFDGRDFETVNCVRGYHIYKTIWSPTTGCEREEAIPEDPYAVAIVAERVTVGQKDLSCLLALFTKARMDYSHYSEGLLQGGLAVHFQGREAACNQEA